MNFFKKKDANRLMWACLVLIFLLLAQELILARFNKEESLFFQWQKKVAYGEAIEKGMEFYTEEKQAKLEFDEYFLLKEIIGHKNKKLVIDDKKYFSDPFRRLLDRKNPMDRIAFTKKNQALAMGHQISNSFYDIDNVPSRFLADATDDVVLKALYCDLTGYAEDDFKILKALNSGDGGYLDTHFLIGLMLLKNNHCYEEEKINEQVGAAVASLVKAQKNDIDFSDLYAERIVVLYWAGYGHLVEKEWVEKVRDALMDDPGWRDREKIASDAHTTGLAILAMLYYSEGKSTQIFY